MNGKEFAKLRKEVCKSAKEASEKTNTPYSTWLKWEKGDRRVPGTAVAYLLLLKKQQQLKKNILAVLEG